MIKSKMVAEFAATTGFVDISYDHIEVYRLAAMLLLILEYADGAATADPEAVTVDDVAGRWADVSIRLIALLYLVRPTDHTFKRGELAGYYTPGDMKEKVEDVIFQIARTLRFEGNFSREGYNKQRDVEALTDLVVELLKHKSIYDQVQERVGRGAGLKVEKFF
jgi:hypothetical protein